MVKNIILVLLVLAVLIIIFIASPQNKIYRNSILGISFSYPKGWEVNENLLDDTEYSRLLVWEKDGLYKSPKTVLEIWFHSPDSSIAEIEASPICSIELKSVPLMNKIFDKTYGKCYVATGLGEFAEDKKSYRLYTKTPKNLISLTCSIPYTRGVGDDKKRTNINACDEILETFMKIWV